MIQLLVSTKKLGKIVNGTFGEHLLHMPTKCLTSKMVMTIQTEPWKLVQMERMLFSFDSHRKVEILFNVVWENSQVMFCLPALVQWIPKPQRQGWQKQSTRSLKLGNKFFSSPVGRAEILRRFCRQQLVRKRKAKGNVSSRKPSPPALHDDTTMFIMRCWSSLDYCIIKSQNIGNILIWTRTWTQVDLTLSKHVDSQAPAENIEFMKMK